MSPALAALLDALRTGRAGGKALRAAAGRVDADAALQAELVAAVAADAGEDDVASWSTRKLLRRALGRADGAMQVGTLTARDEAFTCAACGRDVPPGGRTARDHCPWCLASLHVDDVPGDRAATCGGLMRVVDVVIKGDVAVLGYRCTRCGFTRNMRALAGVEVPDDWAAIVRASAQGGR